MTGVWTFDRVGDASMMGSQLALPVNVSDDGEVRLYKIALPFLPPSKNVYDNWPPEWKHSAKKKWEKHIVAACREMAMPLNVPKVGLAATLTFPNRNRRDLQNYAQALWHWVPDALQVAGVISGDHEGKVEIGRNWGLTFSFDTRVTVAKKRRERTVLAVTMFVPGKGASCRTP